MATPEYLLDFEKYEREMLLKYAEKKNLLGHFTPDDEHTNEDLRRMIRGALWQHTGQGYKQST